MIDKEACAQCRADLPWYAAGSLPADRRTAIAGHLEACAACRAELAQWQTIHQALQEADRQLAPDLETAQGWASLAGKLPAPRRRFALPGWGSRAAFTDADVAALEPPGLNHQMTPRPRISAPARHWVPALVVTLLIILLSAVLFNRLNTAPRTGGSATATPTPAPVIVHQLTASQFLPDTSLAAVQMLSATDGWAVGIKWIVQTTGQNTSNTFSSLILHYTGGKWAPFGQSYPDVQLNSISMDSPTDGWAVGSTFSGNGFILHYTGGQWVEVASPPGLSLFKVQMLSANEGWAIDIQLGSPAHFYLLHFHNGGWSLEDSGQPLENLSMLSATDGWGVGDNGAIAHYQNGKWTRWSSPVPAYLYTIQMVTADDGWAAGVTPDVNLAQPKPRAVMLLHYNGHAWDRVNTPAASFDATYVSEINAFAMLSATDGWAVGSKTRQDGQGMPLPCPGQQCDPGPDTYEQSLLWHYTGGQWVAEGDEYNAQLESVSMVSADEGWAVGTTVDPNSYFNPSASVLLHYQHGVWTPYQPAA